MTTNKHETGECLTCSGGGDRPGDVQPEKPMKTAFSERIPCGACDGYESKDGTTRWHHQGCPRDQRPSDAPARPKGDGPQRWWRAMPECGGPWCYDDSLTNLVAMIDDGASPGESYTIECVELTPEQVANMGDFGGW